MYCAYIGLRISRNSQQSLYPSKSVCDRRFLLCENIHACVHVSNMWLAREHAWRDHGSGQGTCHRRDRILSSVRALARPGRTGVPEWPRFSQMSKQTHLFCGFASADDVCVRAIARAVKSARKDPGPYSHPSRTCGPRFPQISKQTCLFCGFVWC